jgi:predicted DCC family thiol-disulfide oxidoreductase YuxK
MSTITVIFDGDCEFCQQSVTWIQQKLALNAIAFQAADLQPFNLTREQCAKQLYVISGSHTYAGADAISYLLIQRGNKVSAILLRSTGSVGRAGYRWVASHRSSWVIKVATRVLHLLNK